MNSIALVDFNSFFASVEQQHNPKLRGKPVGVLPVMAETTSCIAASYEAKAFGVKTGTGVREARKLCPSIVFVEARHALYVQVHKQSVKIVDRIAPVYEVLSIDEMACELTGRWSAPEQAIKIAHRIKAALRAELGECMQVSIGIAPNTLLAKLASNMQKPDGLVLLGIQDIPAKFLHLLPSAINGIGPRMAKRLEMASICTMADLYAAPRDVLRSVWGGVAGHEMYDMLRGVAYAPRVTTARSLGHSHMLPPAMRNPTDAFAVLSRLTQKAAMRLRKQGFYASGMAVHVRSENAYHANAEERQHGGRDTRFGETQDTAFFLQTLHTLWHSGLHNIQKPKAVGMVLHGLVLAGQHTGDLFDAPGFDAPTVAPVIPPAIAPASTSTSASASASVGNIAQVQNARSTPNRPLRDRSRLHSAMDSINKTQGKNALYFATAHGALDHAPMRIAFNRIPDVETER